jgi:hypothetical protein
MRSCGLVVLPSPDRKPTSLFFGVPMTASVTSQRTRRPGLTHVERCRGRWRGRLEGVGCQLTS